MKRAFFAILVLFAALARAFDSQTEFAAGNSAYEQGKFAEAAARYRRLISNDVATASVWFNLGNSEYKVGSLGRAIAAYRRAEQLTPRDSALRANLNFVRRKATGEQDSRVLLTLTTLRFLKPNEWAILASISSALFFLVLAVSEARRARIRGFLVMTGLITAAFVAAAVASHRDRFGSTQAVVVATQSAVRFGPLEESQTAFSLHQGAEVVVLDRSAGWLQVRDTTRRAGWLKTGDVNLVTP
jgi:tetratricopeptide (TPR) repeat protein